MGQERLSILYVSPMPASPPRFGAQARMHGLMTRLAQRHDLTAVVLVDNEFDAEECRKAMQAYCREVVLVPRPHVGEGFSKRLRQLQSLASHRSFERRTAAAPAMQRALDRVLRASRFDLVNLEFSFLGGCDLLQAPPNERLPRLVVASHNIDYELARQYARAGRSLAHRLYAGVNWRKLRREELGAYRDADGVYLCSAEDERRLLGVAPGARTAVIPNAADVEYYQPRPTDPPPDGRTVVFFGLLSYAPNVDGVIYFVQKIWPRIAEAHPEARLEDHRWQAAAVGSAAGRAPGRANRLCARLAAAPRRGRRRGRPAAAGRWHPPQNRRGHGHGESHRVDDARRRGNRSCPRAGPPHRGPAGDVRGRREPPAWRSRARGTHRPVCKELGGAAI